MTHKKGKVHFIHMTSKPGGIEVLLPVIIKSMPEYDFRALVIKSSGNGGPNIYDSLNIPFEFGHANNLRAFLKIFMYARKNHKDIFHAYNIGPFFLFALKIAGVKKLIYSIHGTIYWKNKKEKIFRELFWKLALNNKLKITSNTQYSSDVFRNKVTSKYNIQVIYNPIDPERFKPINKNETKNVFKIIYAGRLSKGKNLERWIDVACFVHKKIPGTLFEIYGSGTMENLLRNKIEELNASDYIILKGFRGDIENVYREADLMLFLSEYESFGNVAVESILCGTPVLVSDIPSMREIFKDFSEEFILKSGNDIQLEVCDRLKNITELKQKTLKVREVFLRRFSPQVHVEKLRDLYESLEL